MYIDLIIFIVLTIIVFLKYNKFHSYILFFAIIVFASSCIDSKPSAGFQIVGTGPKAGVELP